MKTYSTYTFDLHLINLSVGDGKLKTERWDNSKSKVVKEDEKIAGGSIFNFGTETQGSLNLTFYF